METGITTSTQAWVVAVWTLVLLVAAIRIGLGRPVPGSGLLQRAGWLLPVAALLLVLPRPLDAASMVAAGVLAAVQLVLLLWHWRGGPGSSSWRADNDRQLLARLLENTGEHLFLLDPDRLVLQKLNPDDIAARHTEAAVPQPLVAIFPEQFEVLTDRIGCVIRTGAPETLRATARYEEAGPRQMQLTLAKILYDGRAQVLVLGTNLAGQLQQERQIKQLQRGFMVRDQVNQVILTETSPEALFSQTCRIVVETGGFHLAWIGVVEGGVLKPQAAALSEKLTVKTPPLREQLACDGKLLRQALESRAVQVDNACEPAGLVNPFQGGAVFSEPFSAVVLPVLAVSAPPAIMVVVARYTGAIPETMEAQFGNLSRSLAGAVDNFHTARERELALHRNRLLSSAIEQSANAVCMFDTDGIIRYVNSRFLQLTGYHGDAVLGHSPRFLYADEQEALNFERIFQDLRRGQQWRGELRKRKESGEEFWAMETIAPLRDDSGRVIQYISTSEDVTALRRAQEKIQQLAFYDPLTGLPNRRLLLERLRARIDAVRGNRQKIAVLLLDLDRFKTLNDSLGHDAGDNLLNLAAERLGRLVGNDETAARLGGDEFALLLTGTRHSHDIGLKAERVLEVMREPVELNGITISGSVSIGVAVYPDDGNDAGELLRCADLAMYHAKSGGRDSFQFFTRDINRAALAQIELEHQLKIAVRERQLVPHYQPIWDYDCQVLGFEALARWPRADGPMTPPDVFIGLAEEAGLIEAIGEQILYRACHDIADLSRRFGREFFVSVNLSAVQLRRPDWLMQVLVRALDESGINPQCLELELTESMLVQEVDEALDVMHKLRHLGVRLVIDDFGTGYSSLTYLSRFPIDKLKIDKTFVDEMATSRGRMITSAIVALGSRLDMRVVAEGVEQRDQRDLLRQQGCDQFQGYWFARPMPLASLPAFLTDSDGVVP